MQNILTIDWEDWFHICGVEDLLPVSSWGGLPSILERATELLLSMLQRHRVKATFFLVGYSVRRAPRLVQAIAREGHEVAWHTHEHNLLTRIPVEVFERDLKKGRDLLQEIAGRTGIGFRAPQWSFPREHEGMVNALVKNGFVYDSSRAPWVLAGCSSYPEVPHQLGTKERALVELPPMTFKPFGIGVPAGGSWGARTWPLKTILSKARKLNDHGHPAVFSFHPAEFANRPRLSGLPLTKRFVTRFGRRKAGRVLEDLLANLPFQTAEEFVASQKKFPCWKNGAVV